MYIESKLCVKLQKASITIRIVSHSGFFICKLYVVTENQITNIKYLKLKKLNKGIFYLQRELFIFKQFFFCFFF